MARRSSSSAAAGASSKAWEASVRQPPAAVPSLRRSPLTVPRKPHPSIALSEARHSRTSVCRDGAAAAAALDSLGRGPLQRTVIGRPLRPGRPRAAVYGVRFFDGSPSARARTASCSWLGPVGEVRTGLVREGAAGAGRGLRSAGRRRTTTQTAARRPSPETRVWVDKVQRGGRWLERVSDLFRQVSLRCFVHRRGGPCWLAAVRLILVAAVMDWVRTGASPLSLDRACRSIAGWRSCRPGPEHAEEQPSGRPLRRCCWTAGLVCSTRSREARCCSRRWDGCRSLARASAPDRRWRSWSRLTTGSLAGWLLDRGTTVALGGP